MQTALARLFSGDEIALMLEALRALRAAREQAFAVVSAAWKSPEPMQTVHDFGIPQIDTLIDFLEEHANNEQGKK